MITLIQDRKNNMHLCACSIANSHKLTLCGVIYQKNDIINTFSLDDAISPICPKCYFIVQQAFSHSHESNVQHHAIAYYEGIQFNIRDTKNKFWTLNNKNWGKLNKYRSKLLWKK